jgi:hypothetical protein
VAAVAGENGVALCLCDDYFNEGQSVLH